jgi:hypothetical protein
VFCLVNRSARVLSCYDFRFSEIFVVCLDFIRKRSMPEAECYDKFCYSVAIISLYYFRFSRYFVCDLSQNLTNFSGHFEVSEDPKLPAVTFNAKLTEILQTGIVLNVQNF